jgi:hypothetical protein
MTLNKDKPWAMLSWPLRDAHTERARSVHSSRWDGAIFLMIPGTSCLATIRAVSPGQRPFAHRSASDYLALMGLNTRLRRPAPFGARARPIDRYSELLQRVNEQLPNTLRASQFASLSLVKTREMRVD